MLGDWCLQQENEVLTFRRDDCLDQANNWLLIDRDGYRGHEFGGKTVKSSISRQYQRYVCRLRGGISLRRRGANLGRDHQHVARL
jgi:hypothetical protein